MAFVVLPPGVLERQVGHGGRLDAEHVTDRSVALAEDVVEPVRPRAGYVGGELPGRPLERRGPGRQLFGGQRSYRSQEQSLVARPAFREGLQDAGCVRHGSRIVRANDVPC